MSSKKVSIEGKIKLITDMQTFESGFYKNEVIITTDEQYPQDVKITLVKEKAAQAASELKAGQSIEMFYNIRGNEYNGKYYVDLQGWSWTSNAVNDAPAIGSAAESAPAEDEDDLPF